MREWGGGETEAAHHPQELPTTVTLPHYHPPQSPTTVTPPYHPPLSPFPTITHHNHPPLSPFPITHHNHPPLSPFPITHQCHPSPLSPTTITHHCHPSLSPTTITHHCHPVVEKQPRMADVYEIVRVYGHQFDHPPVAQSLPRVGGSPVGRQDGLRTASSRLSGWGHWCGCPVTP